MDKFVSLINDIVWSPALVVLLVGAGLYFSIRTRFVQVRKLGLMVKSLFAPAQKDKDGRTKGISSFQAFSVALSGRVGTGNIVGVATAIAMGGPGAVFWMWIIAFLGASTAFVESTLAQLYNFPHSSGLRGGPACYIEKGLKCKWLAVLFAVLTLFGYGLLLATVQSNGVTNALGNSFSIPPLWCGLGLAFLLALVIVGGIKSIAKVASVVTPFMALGYIVLTVVVVARHWDMVPSVFNAIFTGALGIKPVAGGILGSTIMMGVKRGIFSNEAGQGGGAIVSASASVSHPAKQGLAQAFSVYVDTILICTGTALMILCSGTYNIFDAKTGEMLEAVAPELGGNYVGYTQAAVDSVLSGIGGGFVSIALVFFVFTTLMAYYFYGESSIMYIFQGKPRGEKAAIWCFRTGLLLMTVFGALKEANVIWQLGDIGVGVTAWINVIALLLLCPQAIKALREFEKTQ
ncbi:MAG: alanine:cation symporter family protein [Bacteroidales bacterium]|nr:alanine:cation symporter family protein [Bacteroidales bacterium]